MQAARRGDGGADAGPRSGSGAVEADAGTVLPALPPQAPGGPVRRGVPAGGPDHRAHDRTPRDHTPHDHAPDDDRPPGRRHRARSALAARRERLRGDARKERVYRVVVGVLGASVVLVGLALVPLPGPGWLVVFLGLAVLGSEFRWARRLQAFARRHVHAWSEWIARRSWRTRVVLGSATALVVVGAAYGYLAWQGVPPWSPEVVTAQLVRVPGL